jgi:hypothetical protein
MASLMQLLKGVLTGEGAGTGLKNGVVITEPPSTETSVSQESWKASSVMYGQYSFAH